MERWGLLAPYRVVGRLLRGHPGGERIQPGAFAGAVAHHAGRLRPLALDWPEAEGAERERRRPYLRAVLALCEAHIAYEASDTIEAHPGRQS